MIYRCLTMVVAKKLSAISVLFIATLVLTSTVHAGRKPIHSPLLMESDSFAMAVFELNPEDVQPYLPKGVKPKIYDSGMTTAVLEFYKTSLTYGIPNYEVAFVMVDVDHYDSHSGMPGRYPIWGVVSPLEALEVFKDTRKLPYTLADSINISEEGLTHSASVFVSGQEAFNISIEGNPDWGFESVGIANVLGKAKSKRKPFTMVPFFTAGYGAGVPSFNVVNTNDPVLALLSNATILWSIISQDQRFSYAPLVK